MPLLVLGLLVLVGVLIYAIAKYREESEYEEKDSKVSNFIKQLAEAADIPMPGQKQEEPTEESKTVNFPSDNLETEKFKRNIHSD